MTDTTHNSAVEREAAFLVTLAEAGIPPDIQELLVHGNPRHGVAPGALRKALAAMPPQAPGWRPIAEAPRDGTWVLLCGGKTNEYRHDLDYDPVGVFRPVVAFWDAGDWGEDGGQWSYDFWDGDWRSSYSNPTHFRPLPAPPLENDDG